MNYQSIEELASKVATEKIDYSRSFPSAKMANLFAWEMVAKLNLPTQSIKTWRRGRCIVKCEMETDIFYYFFDAEEKRVYISFLANHGENTPEQIQEESILNERKRKLISNEIWKELDHQGDTAEMNPSEIKVICKLFNPSGPGTWYIYDFDRACPDRLWIFANLGDPEMAECGTIFLSELAEFTGPFGLGIERDIHYVPGFKTLQEVIDTIKSGGHV